MPVVRTRRDAGRALLREDHLVEWVQFGVCVLVAWFACAAGAQLLAPGPRWVAVALLVLWLGMAALAGEEISWGPTR